VKITVLAENTACREDVAAQHGLSLLVETRDQKILFDMGQDDTFLRNARALNIDLSQVDLAVLSHGHYDHGGGLETFLKVNDKAPVYIHEDAFGDYYNGTEKYIGLNKALQGSRRLVFTKKTVALSANLLLTDCNDLGWIHDSWGLNRREGETFLPDDFIHEQYLLIQEGEKKILISGCSHKGILNIAAHFRPHVLIGGFHLSKETDPARLRKLAETLLQGNTLYYTGHCTGASQFDIMKCVMGSSLQPLSTGLVFEV
jgi:7,8-dihydropterin-6-yl-methyl-4-(beta-D-ribofuranosyl)aminobenzene 5'-phosphate synthase